MKKIALAIGAVSLLSISNTQAQTHIGDVTIDGSLCVGFDCAATESFGFDTERLKENNLRLHFDDTSATNSFPRNDWRITINDSSNGGASYFAIDDVTAGRQIFRVDAGAPANSLRVDSGGDVGIGTAVPVVELHIKDGDTPTMRLEQDGSAGFTPQTWDVAGNETNFFIRDVTNGSTLPFRIRPGAPTSAIEIDGDGEVGINSSSPNADIDITSNDGPTLRLTNTSAITVWEMINHKITGRLIITDDAVDGTSGAGGIGVRGPFKIKPNAANNSLVINTSTGGDGTGEARVGIGTGAPAGTLDVNGTIFQRGGVLHADYVFHDSYELESIEEHARAMWGSKHLPAVPASRKDELGREILEVGAHRRGMLEELEKAHIYIEDLHGQLTALEQRLAKLEGDKK